MKIRTQENMSNNVHPSTNSPRGINNTISRRQYRPSSTTPLSPTKPDPKINISYGGCDHSITLPADKALEDLSRGATRHRMESPCPTCELKEKLEKDKHERNTVEIRRAWRENRLNLIDSSRSGHMGLRFGQCKAHQMRILAEWKKEIERFGFGERNGETSWDVTMGLERAIKAVIEKVGVLASVAKSEVEEKNLRKQEMDEMEEDISDSSNDDPDVAERIRAIKRFKQLEEIKEGLVELKGRLKGVSGYSDIVEEIESGFDWMVERATCILRDEEYTP